jgi:hypothetical protein
MDPQLEATRPSPATEVCLTIDTEFGIGGAFNDPTNRLPIGEAFVRCPAEGVEHGLPFILRTLARFGVPATFFVETLNAVHFGDLPMRRVGDAILEAGQDIQLHLHPCWLYFRGADWAQRLKRVAPNDSCAGRSLSELDDIIGAGLEPFARFGWPRPVALRTGNLETDHTVYTAMSRFGFKIASNIGLGCFQPSDPALHLRAGRHWINGVLEVPVLSYLQLAIGVFKRLHLVTITGVGQWEMTALLRRARQWHLAGGDLDASVRVRERRRTRWREVPAQSGQSTAPRVVVSLPHRKFRGLQRRQHRRGCVALDGGGID